MENFLCMDFCIFDLYMIYLDHSLNLYNILDDKMEEIQYNLANMYIQLGYLLHDIENFDHMEMDCKGMVSA